MSLAGSTCISDCTQQKNLFYGILNLRKTYFNKCDLKVYSKPSVGWNSITLIKLSNWKHFENNLMPYVTECSVVILFSEMKSL